MEAALVGGLADYTATFEEVGGDLGTNQLGGGTKVELREDSDAARVVVETCLGATKSLRWWGGGEV